MNQKPGLSPRKGFLYKIAKCTATLADSFIISHAFTVIAMIMRLKSVNGWYILQGGLPLPFLSDTLNMLVKSAEVASSSRENKKVN